jgi:hypothetical protein
MVIGSPLVLGFRVIGTPEVFFCPRTLLSAPSGLVLQSNQPLILNVLPLDAA